MSLVKANGQWWVSVCVCCVCGGRTLAAIRLLVALKTEKKMAVFKIMMTGTISICLVGLPLLATWRGGTCTCVSAGNQGGRGEEGHMHCTCVNAGSQGAGGTCTCVSADSQVSCAHLAQPAPSHHQSRECREMYQPTYQPPCTSTHQPTNQLTNHPH